VSGNIFTGVICKGVFVVTPIKSSIPEWYIYNDSKPPGNLIKL